MKKRLAFLVDQGVFVRLSADIEGVRWMADLQAACLNDLTPTEALIHIGVPIVL